jgi:hypothetical protein
VSLLVVVVLLRCVVLVHRVHSIAFAASRFVLRFIMTLRHASQRVPGVHTATG